jgi:hypothetical protein
MNTKFHLSILSFLVICYSCKNNSKNDIELGFLNKNLKAYCIKGDCTYKAAYNFENYKKKSVNKVRFKIKNNSHNNYYINTYCINEYATKGCTYQESFPDVSFGLSLNNLLIRDNNKIITSDYIFQKELFIETECSNYNDSLLFKRYHSLGYKNDAQNYINYNVTKNLIKIRAGETLYFETYINLPFNNSQFVKLSPDKKYTASLTFYADTTNLKKVLTWAQLKDIEENNYKLYQGTITSTNSIPIVFVEE